MNTDPFAPTLFDTPCRYPALLMFAVAHGIRPTSTAQRVTQAQLDATARATKAALAKARAQRAVTEAWYASRKVAA